MPWFALDDGFDTHPKVRKAGNAAAGLFCRLGAHCAKHLTEGLVDGVTARSYGTAAQLRKLTEVGMLHTAPHDCPRCQQPEPGGYVIHDFLAYNRSKKQIEAARENGRKRQQKGRDQQRQQRSDPKSNLNRSSPEVQVKVGLGSNGTQNETRFQGESAGQEDMSRRDTLQGDTVVPSQPIPSRYYVPTAEGGEQQPAGVQIPEWAQPLLDGLDKHDIHVSWRLSTMQWIAVQELINTRGVDFLVEQARRRWNPKDPIRFASLLIQIWTEIPAPSKRRRDSHVREVPPHCGDPDCDPVSRQREREDDNGLRTNYPCPECHPNARKDQAA